MVDQPTTPAAAPLPRAGALRDVLRRDGFVVLPAAMPDDLVEQALRRLNLEILRCGISAEQIEEWKFATFWPSIRWEPEFLALLEPLEALIEPGADEVWGEAQLLLRFPDEAPDWPLSPHVDTLPDWADGRGYEAIFGIALSSSRQRDGCLAIWRGSHVGEVTGEPAMVELDRGDVVVMHPRLRHSSTLNRGGSIRYAVYFRLLGPVAPVGGGCL